MADTSSNVFLNLESLTALATVILTSHRKSIKPRMSEDKLLHMQFLVSILIHAFVHVCLCNLSTYMFTHMYLLNSLGYAVRGLNISLSV